MEVGVFLCGITGIQARDANIWAAFPRGKQTAYKPKYIYKVE